MERRAATSLGKHDPPHPIPELRNLEPMRPSSPMPADTSVTSAPTSSQRFEISFMKLILVARKALAAYLIISALTRSVVTNGTATLGLGSLWVGKVCSMIGSYRARIVSRASLCSAPSTILFGKRESYTALP